MQTVEQLPQQPHPSTAEADRHPPAPGQGTAAGPGTGHRLRALDGLRLVAALAVVLHHMCGMDVVTRTHWGASARELFPGLFMIGHYGRFGVQLFFLISGFVICMSAWGRSPGRFVAARVTRLFPAYWFSVVFFLVLWRLLPDGSRTPPSYTDALANLTMFQVPLGARHMAGIYWTLWAELCFYVLFLLVLRAGLDRRRATAFCWLWLLASVLAQRAGGGGAQLPLVDVFAPTITAPLFVGGIAMYLMYRFGPDLRLWGLLGADWLVMQHDLVTSLAAGRDRPFLTWQPYVALIIVTACYLLMLAVALHRLDRVRWVWLTAAGNLTYPLYLIHEELGWALVRTLREHLGPYPTLAATLTAVLLAAWAVHRWVERPLAGLLRRRLRREADDREAGQETGQDARPGDPGTGERTATDTTPHARTTTPHAKAEAEAEAEADRECERQGAAPEPGERQESVQLRKPSSTPAV
ncbi:acyltransferase family protein [Streptomyces iconiensis]|uniref:Acyltransferase n=1 Tax=Streptomyces iconiensis TaxID=1384038 RepID=A0ABT7A8F0_9ACTN|nr:acyltransferase [Streptomyces iconiensis]MDJ1137601.1 acyltransferase [Streptomyces iconiensis]